jgi:hypothetical protein
MVRYTRAKRRAGVRVRVRVRVRVIFFCLYGHSLVQQGRAMRAKLTH